MTRIPPGLRAGLLRWYHRNRRDLPWRRAGDAYAVWVSEVMLQQTRVATVLPYYERFMTRFPDVAGLARAEEEQVLAVWSGLGYYRRARALREGAIAVMERHGGRVPGDPEALRALPGIGRYTAGAIASIGFDRAEPVLDGNVRRVLSRIFAEERDARLWEIAGQLVRGRRPGDLNQALMELGALVCTPRTPSCSACPAAKHCAALASGDPAGYPRPRPRPAAVEVRVAVAVCRRAGRILLERPVEGNPFRGRWDLPAVEVKGEEAGPALERSLEARGLAVATRGPVGRTRHGILNRRLLLTIMSCSLRRGRVAGTDAFRWADPRALDEVAVSGATRKVLRSVGLEG